MRRHCKPHTGFLGFNVTAPVKARKYAANVKWTANYNALQGDRACEGAEIREDMARNLSDSMLQCDRACEGAEICSLDALTSSATLGFNVTAPVKARKSKSPLPFTAGFSRFNVTAPVKARKSAQK